MKTSICVTIRFCCKDDYSVSEDEICETSVQGDFHLYGGRNEDVRHELNIHL